MRHPAVSPAVAPVHALRVAVALLTFVMSSFVAPASTDAQSGGNPVLTVSPATLPADRVSTVTVTGRNYLVPPHAPGTDVFGGVYVFFGWVAGGAWGPSARNSNNNNGMYGVTYAYPGDGGDPGTRDDGTGTMRLVAFTPGGESGNATNYHMDRDGNWTTTLRVYGSTFTTTNPVTGQTRTYDCRQVQCGVFTVGAHGKASATNERFTPITFTGSSPSSPLGPGSAGGSPSAGGPGAAPGGSPSVGGPSGGSAATVPDDTQPGASAGVDGPPEGDDLPDAGEPDADMELLEELAGPDPGRSPLPDGETVALRVTSVRSTGDGRAGPLLAGAVVAALVAMTLTGLVLGLWSLRRDRARAREAEPDQEPPTAEPIPTPVETTRR